MGMGGFFGVGFAEEDEADHAAAVEAGRERGEGQEREDRDVAVMVGRLDDGVLGIPAGEERDRAVRERRGDERRGGEGHLLQQAAHLEHVLLVVAAVDDGAGAEEQRGLEERVHRHVHQRECGVTEADRAAHDAEVGERRVGEGFLDVRLREGAEAGERGHAGAGDCDEVQHIRGEQEAHAGHEVNARGHHRRGVDERGDRRRAGHRVREPHVQGELGGLAEEAAHEQRADGDGKGLRSGGVVLQRDEVERAVEREAHRDAEDEPEVTDAIDDKRLLRGSSGVVLVEVMRDQHVRAETHEFPEDERHEQVVGDNDAQDGEHKDRETGEETAAGRVFLHVADGEEVNPRGDERHHEEHQAGVGVDEVAETEADAAELRELDVPGEVAAGLRQERERETGEDEGGASGEPSGEAAGTAQKQRGERGGSQRQEQDPVDQGQKVRRHRKGLVAEGGERVGLHGAALAEQGHDEREADGDLGGRDGDDEEDKDGAVHGAVEAREGDERERGGGEHELEAHVDDEQVAADEHASQA